MATAGPLIRPANSWPGGSVTESRHTRPGADGADATCEPPSSIHLHSSQRSFAVCHLLSGSLERHFFITRSSAGGVIGWREEMGRGSISRIFAIRLAWLLPS